MRPQAPTPLLESKGAVRSRLLASLGSEAKARAPSVKAETVVAEEKEKGIKFGKKAGEQKPTATITTTTKVRLIENRLTN